MDDFESLSDEELEQLEAAIVEAFDEAVIVHTEHEMRIVNELEAVRGARQRRKMRSLTG